MTIQPTLRNILAEEIVDEPKNGILVPENSNQNKGFYKGKVVAVGQGVRLADGEIVPLIVKKGDIILLWKYSPIKIDDKDYMVTYEENIIAILKNEK